MIKDADNGVGQLAPEIETVISQVVGSWIDNVFNSAEDAKDDDKLIPENKPENPVSHAASQASASGTRMSSKSDCGSPIPSDLGSIKWSTLRLVHPLHPQNGSIHLDMAFTQR